MKIEEFCEKYNFGIVKRITKLSGGFMHKMFKVETDKGIYAIKVLNPEVMLRSEAYNNFSISESISNLAKEHGIVVSSALKVNGEYLTKLDDLYYMKFNFVNGKTLTDEEIKVSHCEKIGKILAQLHSLNYSSLCIEKEIVEYKRLVDWEAYTINSNFSKMNYKDTFLNNYKNYNLLLKKANEKFNETNNVFTLCHSDMDPKNVMWNNDEPIIIDWESASIGNPYRELLEDALCWSGFLSNHFKEEKFASVIQEYSKYKDIKNVNWSNIMWGNLVGRLGWLKYNIERSLGIKSNDSEEMELAENEVSKTIDEINRYLELMETMNNIIQKLLFSENN